jgi:hypothetical protein
MNEALEKADASPVSQERRASIRYALQPHTISTEVVAGSQSDPIQSSARVADISTTGIALILRRPFEPGTILRLTLRTSNATPEQTWQVRVAHLKPRSRTEWLIGCAFERPLSELELKAVL